MSDLGTGGRFAAVLQRIYRVLLVVCPKEFRREYGVQMEQVFRDQCGEKLRRRGVFGLVGLWLRTLLDLAATALVEGSRTMRMKILVPAALVLGLLIALVDTSPGWDDTGVTAAVVFTCCGLLSAVHPARPWLWALIVGLWIPALGIAEDWNYASLLALVVAFAGAYAGKLVRFAAG